MSVSCNSFFKSRSATIFKKCSRTSEKFPGEKNNKIEIKNAVEKLFSVKVKSVNIINIKGKVKRFKGILGKRNDTKKAIITLEEGNTIDISAGV